MEVKIEEQPFALFQIQINNEDLIVASPALDNRIHELILENRWCDEIAEMDGKTCSVRDIEEMYYYVFGNEDNEKPTEQEVVESIMDVME